jgi:hypothetical protein
VAGSFDLHIRDQHSPHVRLFRLCIHSLNQTSFTPSKYVIFLPNSAITLTCLQARKGTLGARLPLEPWDVGAERDMVVEEAPSLPGPENATEDTLVSEFPRGPESLISVNEDVHLGDSPDVIAATKDTHILDSETLSPQRPSSFELGPEEGSHMFASLYEVLSTFSSSPLSRSSSSSSTSSVPALSPDLQTQWSGDSPAQSPNRSSFGGSAPADLSSDDDVMYSASHEFEPGILDSQDHDFFSMPGSFSAADSFQPGTSAGTIRPLVNSLVSDGISTPSDEDWPSTCGDYATPEFDEADMFGEYAENVDKAVDGDDQENYNHKRAEGYEERQTSDVQRGGGRDGRQVNGGDSNGNGFGSAGGGHGNGGRDDRREDERDRRAPSAFSTPSDTESEDSEEDCARHSTQQSQSSGAEEASTSEDDNVPLAQSIPTALRAQRTIRKQVRDEKDERRRQRALKRQQQQRPQIHNQTPLDEEYHAQRGPSLPQASGQPVFPSSRTVRSRTKTLPSNTSRPVVAEDLARRLRDLQDLTVSPASFLNKPPLSPSDSTPHLDPITQQSEGYARIPSAGAQDKSVRPMRSFHRPGAADSARAQPLSTLPLSHDTSRLGRSATSVSRPVVQHDPSETSARATPGSLPTSSRRPQTSEGAHRPSANPTRSPVLQRVSLPRISTDVSNSSSALSAVSRETKQVSWQQRVFIMDLQRFNTVVMNPMTTAGGVIDVLETEGQLANWTGGGGWMLFEVSQDFGMGECRCR